MVINRKVVKRREGEGSQECNKLLTPAPLLHSPSPHSATPIPEKIPVSSSSSPPMANFAVDPRPHVPKGFALVEQPLRPPLRYEVYVTGCYTLANEDLAIIKLNPPVHKDDFRPLATELRHYFTEVHRAYVAEIQPCPIGDAFIRFGSALERERFLGPVFTFGSYEMTVLKHDEGENARSFDLDREAWVMLVTFREDLKNTVTVAKAVSGFGILVDWHEYDNLARVVQRFTCTMKLRFLILLKSMVGCL